MHIYLSFFGLVTEDDIHSFSHIGHVMRNGVGITDSTISNRSYQSLHNWRYWIDFIEQLEADRSRPQRPRSLGQHQESRHLGCSNTRTPRFKEFSSNLKKSDWFRTRNDYCAYSEIGSGRGRDILVPRAHDPSGLRQGSRALASSDFLSTRRLFVSYS